MKDVERVLDDIDALVDASLEGGEPVGGYDYGDPDFPRCGHCDRAWHGLPVTERIAEMYAEGCYDEDYRMADDDSQVICPGSDFIGPVPMSEWNEKRLRGWLDEFEAALSRHTTTPPLGSRYDFSSTTCHWSISDNAGNVLSSGTYTAPPGVWPNITTSRGAEATQCLVDEMPLQIVTSEDIPVGTYYLIPTDDDQIVDLGELPPPPES